MLFVFSSTYIKKFEPVPVSILVKSNIETNSFVNTVVKFNSGRRTESTFSMLAKKNLLHREIIVSRQIKLAMNVVFAFSKLVGLELRVMGYKQRVDSLVVSIKWSNS